MKRCLISVALPLGTLCAADARTYPSLHLAEFLPVLLLPSTFNSPLTFLSAMSEPASATPTPQEQDPIAAAAAAAPEAEESSTSPSEPIPSAPSTSTATTTTDAPAGPPPPPIKNLILDAAPLLTLTPLRGLASKYLIAPQVLAEIRDRRAREHFERLALLEGVEVEVRDIDPISLAKGKCHSSGCRQPLSCGTRAD